MGSKLLILATRIEKAVNLPGDSSLHDLEAHAANPAVVLQPTPADLEPIANYILARLDSAGRVDLKPTQKVLNQWHKSFGREIGAFVVAISQRRQELARGDFTLPESAGATWMKERHLGGLEPPDIENAVCLAIFGEQEFELDVPEQCLPHPLRIDRLLKSGLVERITVGDGRFVRYGLREPGWGRLILSAVEFSPDRRLTIIEAGAKNIVFAYTIACRLHQSKQDEEFRSYWKGLAHALAANPDQLAERALESPFHLLSAFLATARKQGQKALLDALWGALATKAKAERLAERALETPFDALSALLGTAREQGQKALLDALWGALATKGERLAERALESPLDDLSAFLGTAREQGQTRLLDALWGALATKAERLAAQASKQDPGHLLSFLAVAPMNLKRDIIQRFKVEEWAYGTYQRQRVLTYAPSLAGQFGLTGRDDLKIALIDNILRRPFNSEVQRADFWR